MADISDNNPRYQKLNRRLRLKAPNSPTSAKETPKLDSKLQEKPDSRLIDLQIPDQAAQDSTVLLLTKAINQSQQELKQSNNDRNPFGSDQTMIMSNHS